MKVTICCIIASLGIAAVLPAGADERSASAGATDPADARSGEGILGLSRVGKSRYDWAWLAKRFDRDGDETVTRDELGWPAEEFARLDRTWDSVLTAQDLDWSRVAPLTKQKETTFALFKEVDKNSNGRIAAEEWQDVFAKIAGEKGYLNEEDLERLIYLPRVVKTQREEASRFRSLDSLLDGGKLPSVPEPGEMAPDFELRTADGQRTVRLSSLRGQKPVVLIFGCFTCGNYRTYSESLEEIHRRWKDQAEFLRVYVREAHPVGDRAATGTNALAGILYKQPVTFDERCAVAGDFVQAMKIETPLVVDEIDNRVGRDYGAWPDRLYIVDRDGRIAYQGARGPFGFNPREMEQSLLLMLAEESAGDSPNN